MACGPGVGNGFGACGGSRFAASGVGRRGLGFLERADMGVGGLKKGKKRRKGFWAGSSGSHPVSARSRTDKRFLERRRNSGGGSGPEEAPFTGGELLKQRLREHWVWMFETEIHSRSEMQKRLLFLLLPMAVVVIISEVLIPRLFALLFG